MTEACLAAGLAVPELEEFATHFRVTLRAAEPTEHAQHSSTQRTETRTATRNASLLRVLIERSKENGASARELAEAMGVTDRTVRLQMSRLIAEGKAVALGSGPNDPQRRYVAVVSQPPAPSPADE